MEEKVDLPIIWAEKQIVHRKNLHIDNSRNSHPLSNIL